jgi:hypothetical protein
MRRLSIIVWLGVALLAGCGGSPSSITSQTGSSTTGTSTTGTGTTTPTVLSMGSGTGSSFQSGVLAVSTTALSAGGSSSLQVSVVDQTGALYTTSTAVTFSSPCQAQGLATITATGVTPASPTVTTTTGSASATYVATGCSGSDVITASASANSQSLTATGTVTVAQAAIGSISFISATPSNITLKGTGATTNGTSTATSTVIFKVLDTSGGPRAGASVTFALSTSVGGITLSPTSGTTDANGQVQTVVSGGSVATTVRVTATTTGSSGSAISTESSALTVSTGIPTSNNISLSVKCQNVEAWELDGVTVPVTVRMTDRFSNPVPDGTTANFQTTLGGIQATCQTGSDTPGSGSCSVNWTSKAPYSVSGNPATTAGNANANTTAHWCGPTNAPYCNATTNGRSPIIVTAIGEESFIDANGSGVFNSVTDTVPFDPTDKDNDFANGIGKPWFDTSEPFLNEWELYDAYLTPTYVLGEPFIDFNNNGKRDGPDGLFEGALCSGQYCNTASSTVAIYDSNVIVVSGQHANFTLLGTPPYTLPATIQMYIYDDRYQQMPAGTTVTYSFSTNAGTGSGPAPAAWPCSTATPVFDSSGNVVSAGQLYSLGATPPTSGAVAGNMYVTVTTPLGLVTTVAIPVTN